MLPSQMGQIWPSPGELDSCRGLRSLQGPNNAELATKVHNCCPELAVLGANETGVFYPHSHNLGFFGEFFFSSARARSSHL